MQKNFSYVHGATAEKLEYDVYENNEVLRAKKQHKSNKKQQTRFVLSLILVLVAGLAIMGRFALVTKLSYEIVSSEKAYNELRNQNSQLRLKIETSTDLEKIRVAAGEKLGMQKPDKSQIVYINVPRNDYTVVMKNDSVNTAEIGNQLGEYLQEKAAGFASLLSK